jgi:hypothetical protein
MVATGEQSKVSGFILPRLRAGVGRFARLPMLDAYSELDRRDYVEYFKKYQPQALSEGNPGKIENSSLSQSQN